MIPLFHDLDGERVVIFGGGSVAARKAAYFADEATVVVVARVFEDRFQVIECDCRRTEIDAELVESLVADAFLVVPATDDEQLNERIGAIAAAAGCLVNPVDHRGGTVTPSTIDGSNITVAISTHGQSPATSKYLRKRLEPEIERADPMVELQASLRDRLADREASERHQILWEVLDDTEIWRALSDGDESRAETLVMEHL